MSWIKQPAWAGTVHIGCLTCSPMPNNAPLCLLGRVLSVGFGTVTVTCDGKGVYDEQDWLDAHGWQDPAGMSDEALEAACAADEEMEDPPSLQDYEIRAAADPDHDWQVHFYGAMHSETYQRQGPEAWVLIHSDQGFA